MNQQFVENISDIIFIERQQLFTRADAVIYHPGHFPELNEQISNLFHKEGFNHLFIPNVYNSFLQANEYEYHTPLLVELDIPADIIHPIAGEFNDGCDVVIGAVQQLDKDMRNILLAGKAFFCRRFLILATLHADSNRIFDVLPLLDHRGIDKENWYRTDKGKARVFNEMKVINSILNG
ncbi:hypothetical protein SAMN05661091_1711 [Paenibacillus uliginis N3/975]|uniref:Uncharacterized protein n=1 Tax=Paenibacillus uliginis N3/975 TaxID=1313296 RepID=A0A1X7H5G1_9BACL|nr:hypothetical protein [Paenibacillus uliginis]SMF79502.1 hypothetical protein SAMN05661091_1711 [Paenibacillus uliginis N3/975]